MDHDNAASTSNASLLSAAALISHSHAYFLPRAGAGGGGMTASGPYGLGKNTVLILLTEVALR